MAQRLKTGKEFTFFLIKLAYGIVAFPCLLILGLLSLFALNGAGRTDSYIYTCWDDMDGGNNPGSCILLSCFKKTPSFENHYQ